MQTILAFLVLLWVLVFLLRYIYDWISPSAEITFSPFDVVVTSVKADGKTLAAAMSAKLQHLKETQAAADAQARADAVAAAGARANASARIKADRRATNDRQVNAAATGAAESLAGADATVAAVRPAGYGFLDIPSIIVPGLAQTRSSGLTQQLENLHLKVQDVDVNSLVKVLREVFRPPETRFTGTLTELPDAVEISCQLLRGDSIRASWRSSRAKQAGTEEQIVDALLDDILFQFLYDLPRLESLKPWRGAAHPPGEEPPPGDQLDASKRAYAFPNWRAMEALVRGLESLNLYQQALDHALLVRAQNQLQPLQIVAPEFALGLYFYGIALTENQQEGEAAELFHQIATLPRAEESIRFYARLQEAGTRLRLYDTKEAQELAVPLLRKLIEDLADRLSKASEVEVRQNYEQLLALAEAQLGYTYGTLIVLTADSSLNDQEGAALARRWYGRAETEIAEAKRIADSHPEWEPSHANEVRFRILNAQGYSLFRHAQQSGLNDHDFLEKCAEAILVLQQARRRRPNHYEVLQNLAMIYDDKRYDPEGIFLSSAERLYKQTMLFVPEDFYQYERLAGIEFRRMKATTPSDEEQVRAYAQSGLKYVNQALQRRSQSHAAHLLRAAFTAALWATGGGVDAAQKNAAAAAFISALQASLTFTFSQEYHDQLVFCADTLRALGHNPGTQEREQLKQLQLELDRRLPPPPAPGSRR